MPIVPGHTLICPQRCVSKIDDLTEDELHAIFDLQKQLKSAMIKGLGAKGFNYDWNEGKLAGQNIPHLHLYILPRKILILVFLIMNQENFYIELERGPLLNNKNLLKSQN